MGNTTNADFRTSFRLAKALTDAGQKLAETAEALNSWKGVEAAAHKANLGLDGDYCTISISIEVQTKAWTGWLWGIEVRCGDVGWTVHDRRQWLNESGEEQFTEMPVCKGTTLDELLLRMDETISHIVRNITGGWWLHATPKKSSH